MAASATPPLSHLSRTEPRAESPCVGPEVSPRRFAAEESQCLQVHPLLQTWLKQGCTLLQKGLPTSPGLQSFLSRMGPSIITKQGVGRGVGAHVDCLEVHQRAPSVGHLQSQHAQRTVLQCFSVTESSCFTTLQAHSQQGAGAVTEIQNGTATITCHHALYCDTGEDSQGLHGYKMN